MYKVVVKAFGEPDQLQILELPDPIPDRNSNQVVVRLTSIGMNHADLMARRGKYKLLSGEPPFTPGVEGGGYIEAIGDDVSDRFVGQRVILSIDAPQIGRRSGSEGTYQSHYLTTADKTIPVPEAIPDQLLGAIWLPYLTAWGCLIWKQRLQPGEIVLLPGASSSVAIAASQIVKHYGGIAIGTTTSPDKLEKLRTLPEAHYDHLVAINDPEWSKEIRKFTNDKGLNVIFDPVASGKFLNTEICLLANEGTIWIYGLLGKVGIVDVTPLIRKRAAIRGWVLNELGIAEPEHLHSAYKHILESLAARIYQLPVAKLFSLQDVCQAHEEMEKGKHVGKLILIPY
jgi:NADPH:quinone reductase